MIHINTNRIDEFKNLKDDFYIITDFDHTLTTAKSSASMGIIPKFLGGECLKQRLKIYEYYRPLELDYTIDLKEKQKIMKEWARKSFTLLSKYVESEKMIKKSLNGANLYLRDGAKEFLKEMNNKNIPIVIMSSGVGNIVKAFLEKENCMFNNIDIISNFLKFNNKKAYIDFDEIMATSNKEYKRIPEKTREKLEQKRKSILLGDLIEDIKMADKENLQNTLTIGFLDENIEQNLEKYNNSFDIVLTDNSDFNDVKNILNIF